MATRPDQRPVDAGPRGMQRFKTFVPCALEQNGALVRVHVLNLSATGAMVATPAKMAPRQPIALQFDSASYRAVVVWAGEKRAGVRFSLPLSLPTLQKLIA